jgi:hypothetical protein
MNPFDWLEPVNILRSAVDHFDAMRLVESPEDYLEKTKEWRSNKWLSRLLKLRLVFINAVYREGIPKLDALKVFEQLEVEAKKVGSALFNLSQVHNDELRRRKWEKEMTDKVTIYKEYKSAIIKVNALATEIINSSYIVESEYFRLLSCFEWRVPKMSERSRNKPGPKPNNNRRKELAIKLLHDHKKKNPDSSEQTRINSVNESLIKAGFAKYAKRTLKNIFTVTRKANSGT